MPNYNPIVSIDGNTIKCPSKFNFTLEDVSSSDAGRTEKGGMFKNRIAQLISIELEWQNITTSELSALLTAFNPEYISVVFLDPRTGSSSSATSFYVGNRTAPMYNARLGIWSNLSLKIIERGDVSDYH